MYWTGKGGVRFIRPIRWIVALLGDKLCRLKSPDVKSGNTTRGHRILGGKDPIAVTIATYEQMLARKLSWSYERQSAAAASKRRSATTVQPDPELLNTLVYLTEFPTAIRG